MVVMCRVCLRIYRLAAAVMQPQLNRLAARSHTTADESQASRNGKNDWAEKGYRLHRYVGKGNSKRRRVVFGVSRPWADPRSLRVNVQLSRGRPWQGCR